MMGSSVGAALFKFMHFKALLSVKKAKLICRFLMETSCFQDSLFKAPEYVGLNDGVPP